MRDAVLGAERVQQARPLDAVTRLERTRRIVHPGMNHLTVVCAGAHARTGLALEHADRVSAARDGEGGRQADHTGPDDGRIDMLHLCSVSACEVGWNPSL